MKYLFFLSDFMAKTGQTKADIARHLGISNAAVSDWFRRDDLRLSTALRILEKYNYYITFSLIRNSPAPMMYFSTINTINLIEEDDEADNRKLGSLRQAIVSSGTSMKNIAKVLGIAPETLSYYWNTDDCPISVFYKVAQHIDCTVSYSINPINR